MKIRIFIDIDKDGIVQIAGLKSENDNKSLCFKKPEATRYEIEVDIPRETDPIKVSSKLEEVK